MDVRTICCSSFSGQENVKNQVNELVSYKFISFIIKRYRGTWWPSGLKYLIINGLLSQWLMNIQWNLSKLDTIALNRHVFRFHMFNLSYIRTNIFVFNRQMFKLHRFNLSHIETNIFVFNRQVFKLHRFNLSHIGNNIFVFNRQVFKLHRFNLSHIGT